MRFPKLLCAYKTAFLVHKHPYKAAEQPYFRVAPLWFVYAFEGLGLVYFVLSEQIAYLSDFHKGSSLLLAVATEVHHAIFYAKHTA